MACFEALPSFFRAVEITSCSVALRGELIFDVLLHYVGIFSDKFNVKHFLSSVLL